MQTIHLKTGPIQTCSRAAAMKLVKYLYPGAVFQRRSSTLIVRRAGQTVATITTSPRTSRRS